MYVYLAYDQSNLTPKRVESNFNTVVGPSTKWVSYIYIPYI